MGREILPLAHGSTVRLPSRLLTSSSRPVSPFICIVGCQLTFRSFGYGVATVGVRIEAEGGSGCATG